MIAKIVLSLLLGSCASIQAPPKPHAPKEFSRGEIILANQLLTKIFDQEMAPLKCVPDIDEASLLLRTINPRREVVQDDLEALLDNQQEVKNLIDKCDQNCTCSYVDELLREHLVVLDKKLKSSLEKNMKLKDQASCLNYAQETFCGSELFQELNREKVDFSYVDEDAP